MHALLSKDYSDLTIDTDRMTHGDVVYERLENGRSGGWASESSFDNPTTREILTKLQDAKAEGILDITPEKLHQRTPLFLGSKGDVEEAIRRLQ